MNFNELSPEQKYAFYKMMKGENLFITGPGGTGKTKLIKHIYSHAMNNNTRIQICALTGCAALLLNCNARTIHSWSGIRIARGTKEYIISNILRNKKAIKSWKSIDILVVDEVSMMSKKIFELLEEIGRIVRKNNLPFGGIQVIFTGDFFQLPPVGNVTEPDTELFCFESDIWNKVFKSENQIELVTIFRQNDPIYIKILLEIRKGYISEESKQILQNYVKREYNPENHSGCVPTKLFAIKNKVEYVNNIMFNKIEEPEYKYNYITRTDCICYLDSGNIFPPEILLKCERMTLMEKEWEVEQLLNNIPCNKEILLKKGANVMCTHNLDIENGICNGSQGVIIGFNIKNGINIPIVKFYNGLTIPIEPHYWQSEEYPCIAVGQVPLCLAWALTIHKIQGSTIPMAEIDIGNTIFEYGQVYVALSRIQSLEGLYLLSFHPQKIKANPKVIEFYKTIIPISPEILNEMNSYFNNYNNPFTEYEYNSNKNSSSPNIKVIKRENNELQEEKFIEEPSNDTITTTTTNDTNLCIICICYEKNVVILPCKHLCICETCSKSKTLKDCPLCRSPINKKMIIYN